MITKDEIQELLHSTETYRVERTTSTGDMDKFQEAICAFANDLPNSRKNGYLILGAYDNGELSGLKVTDDLLKKIAAIRSNGNILPIPVMSVDRFQFSEGDLLVAEVSPSDLPPVRYRGRTFIRIGPRRDIATEAEERILAERRMSFMATFDTMPCLAAKLNDINTDLLRTKYLIPLLGNELVESDTEFTMSTKDLSLIRYISDMIDIGITSLKVEGRMRSNYYIATVISTYREALDAYYNNNLTEDKIEYYSNILNRVANRESIAQFFNKFPEVDGQYYLGRQEVSNQDFLGIVLDYDVNTKTVSLIQKNYFKKGIKVEMFGPNINTFSFIIPDIYDEEGNLLEVANHPEQIIKFKLDKDVYKDDIMRIKFI